MVLPFWSWLTQVALEDVVEWIGFLTDLGYCSANPKVWVCMCVSVFAHIYDVGVLWQNGPTWFSAMRVIIKGDLPERYRQLRLSPHIFLNYWLLSMQTDFKQLLRTLRNSLQHCLSIFHIIEPFPLTDAASPRVVPFAIAISQRQPVTGMLDGVRSSTRMLISDTAATLPATWLWHKQLTYIQTKCTVPLGAVCRAGCSSPFFGPLARMWINQLSMQRMTSVMWKLWLPTQPCSITILWLVTNLHCSVTEAHVYEQLAQGC